MNPSLDHDFTVQYTVSGSASNGPPSGGSGDYTNLSGSIIIPANTSSTYIYVQPLYDTNIEFQESVTLTTVLTNGYLIDPAAPSATLWINDCWSTNVFEPVALNVPTAIGIDFLSQSNCLLLSVNYDGGETNCFDLLNSNGVLRAWSRVHGLPDEVKLTVIKTTANGFTAGDVYYGAWTNIGWLSASGTSSNLSWCQLTNSVVTNAMPIRGSICADQSGVWGGDLIAVTSFGLGDSNMKGVWRVNSSGYPTLVTQLDTLHLEGVITLTNDATHWGPWAGKIITGDEDEGVIYAIETNGVTTPFLLGINPEDFDIIPANQDLYCCTLGVGTGSIVKISRNLFANYIGDLLITQAGEVSGDGASVFVVHWDASAAKFIVHRISLPADFGTQLEHVTFAPINLPITP